MRVVLIALVALALSLGSGSAALAGDDEVVIRENNMALAAAWNNGDAKAVAAMDGGAQVRKEPWWKDQEHRGQIRSKPISWGENIDHSRPGLTLNILPTKGVLRVSVSACRMNSLQAQQ